MEFVPVMMILLLALGPDEVPVGVDSTTGIPEAASAGEIFDEKRVLAHATPPRFPERADEREEMVETLQRYRHVAVTDPRVLEAMRQVPRHRFVPDDQARSAYADSPLPIGHGQTISQPYIVALMTQLAGVEPDMNVLEVGTGSAYQAAILSELTPYVYTMEIVHPLAERAAGTLNTLGYEGVRAREGDGYYGWPEKAPFDRILVTAAAAHIPPPLIRQLKPGGRMVIPVGPRWGTQHLLLVIKDEEGKATTESILPVRFVPLTGGEN